MTNYLRGGSILRIDLTEGRIDAEPVASRTDLFIGGKGINTRMLLAGVSPGTDPFDAGNLLLFGVGPLVGTPFPGACRTDVMAKSPVTGAFGDAGIGGHFGAELKFAGYDHLVITGISARPVYLYIRDGKTEIRDASFLWGRDTYETAELVRRDLSDEGADVLSIGPAGERLVVYASIQSAAGNAAARTGMGAVMGSKKLKAIAVRGSRSIGVARPKEFLAACRKLREVMEKSRYYEDVHARGLAGIHDREMRNLYELTGKGWEGAEAISEVEFQKQYLHKRVGCFACPVACFDSYDIPGAGGAGCMKCSPPGDLTWDVRNPDLLVCWQAFVSCQRYGLDARALSNMLAWLMELHERGIVSAADTDGIAMKWGSPEAILSLAKKVSYREGIGELLAGGLPGAARKIGNNSARYLLLAKGSPSDLHIGGIKTRALAAAVSSIGEDAQIQPALDMAAARRYLQTQDEAAFQEAMKRYKDRAEREVGMRDAPDPRITDGKAALVRHDEERTGVCDIAGVCTWMTSFLGLPVDAETIATFMSLGLGAEVSAGDLTRAALRMQHVERAFGAGLGLTRKDDRVSEAYHSLLRPNSHKRLAIGFSEADLEKMKDDYYELMGWDVKTGLPTRATLERCGLSDVADLLGL